MGLLCFELPAELIAKHIRQAVVDNGQIDWRGSKEDARFLRGGRGHDLVSEAGKQKLSRHQQRFIIVNAQDANSHEFEILKLYFYPLAWMFEDGSRVASAPGSPEWLPMLQRLKMV
jgi:hypothetical protein